MDPNERVTRVVTPPRAVNRPTEPASGRAAAVLLLVHASAAVGLYIAAIAFGEGFAGPPFPPDEAVVVLRADAPGVARVIGTPEPVVGESSTASDPDPRDVAPPWRIDAHGRVLVDPR